MSGIFIMRYLPETKDKTLKQIEPHMVDQKDTDYLVMVAQWKNMIDFEFCNIYLKHYYNVN